MKKSMLIVYTFSSKGSWRNSFKNHLMCFGKYLNNINVVYYHYEYSRDKLLKILKKISFDFILFDRSFFYIRDYLSEDEWQKVLKNFSNDEGKWRYAVKGILPQDEYRRVDRIREFIKVAKIDIVYTLVDKKNRSIFYPKEELGYTDIYTILPGYVDEADRIYVEGKIKNKGSNRKYDIGYRSRKPSYALGDLGFLKTKITDIFIKKSKQYGMKVNIGNTEGKNAKNVFLNEEWYDFLMDCRVALGSLSGSSIMDTDGRIMKKVNYILKNNPKVSYDEIKKDFLWKYEGKIINSAPSPRIFEAAMTKTCQVLVEGDYRIIAPDIDYIELKVDFSNIDDVFKKIQDKEYCNIIAENAYMHLIKSDKYTYKKFSRNVLKSLMRIKKVKKTKYVNIKCIRLLMACHNFYLDEVL